MENPEDSQSISINVRHTHDGTLLYFHIPDHLKTEFIRGIQQGNVQLASGSSLEVSVLPEFISNPEDSKSFKESGLFLHLNIPVSKIML